MEPSATVEPPVEQRVAPAAGANLILVLAAAISMVMSIVEPGVIWINRGVALTLFQVGVVLLLRERLTDWLVRPGPRRLMGWAATRAMTVYLWHCPGFALAYALLTLAGLQIPESTNLDWWLQRPLWAIAPALCAVSLVLAFSRFEQRGRPV